MNFYYPNHYQIHIAVLMSSLVDAAQANVSSVSKVMTIWSKSDVDLLTKLHSEGVDLMKLSDELCRYPKGIVSKLISLKLVTTSDEVSGYKEYVDSGYKNPEKINTLQNEKSAKLKQQKKEKERMNITPSNDELQQEDIVMLSTRYAALQTKHKVLSDDLSRVGLVLATKIQDSLG